jgi:rubrerythrin
MMKDIEDIEQKIHSALLMELLKRDSRDKCENLARLVGTTRLNFGTHVDLKNEKGNVDVVVSCRRTVYPIEQGRIQYENHYVAFELATDVDFDLDKKSEQVNRYHREYKDTRIILPVKYKEIYESLFHANDICVHTWKGTRLWKCKDCGNTTRDDHSPRQPSSCDSCKGRNLYFTRFENVIFE